MDLNFDVVGKEDYVYLSLKSLYDLKQSPRQWYKRFDSWMVYFDFMRSSYDCCVYMKSSSVGYSIYLVSYVDDILIVGSDLFEMEA